MPAGGCESPAGGGVQTFDRCGAGRPCIGAIGRAGFGVEVVPWRAV
jgi:hypothetical protein